jgi:hypothetical protein
LVAKDTIILAAAIGSIAAILVVFIVGVTGILDPKTANRRDDVSLDFVDGTAVVTLKQGQKSGPVIVTDIYVSNLRGEVKINRLDNTPTGIAVKPIVMRVGDQTQSEQAQMCSYSQITLLNLTSNTATFEITRFGGCPYCWHMYRGEI